MIDTTVASAEFGVIGAVAAINAGHDIVVKNDIQDPSGDMAREVAAAWAQAHGGQVATDPITDDLTAQQKSAPLAAVAHGAQVIVSVEPPGMDLVYFPFDWGHRDLIFSSSVAVFEVSQNKVVAKARCFLNEDRTPPLKTHEELLANGAGELKALIQRKSEACVAKLKAGLKL